MEKDERVSQLVAILMGLDEDIRLLRLKAMERLIDKYSLYFLRD